MDINIFVLKIILFSFHIFSIFFESRKSKSTTRLEPQKGNSGVSVKLYFVHVKCTVYLQCFFTVSMLSSKVYCVLVKFSMYIFVFCVNILVHCVLVNCTRTVYSFQIKIKHLFLF